MVKAYFCNFPFPDLTSRNLFLTPESASKFEKVISATFSPFWLLTYNRKTCRISGGDKACSIRGLGSLHPNPWIYYACCSSYSNWVRCKCGLENNEMRVADRSLNVFNKAAVRSKYNDGANGRRSFHDLGIGEFKSIQILGISGDSPTLIST